MPGRNSKHPLFVWPIYNGRRIERLELSFFMSLTISFLFIFPPRLYLFWTSYPVHAFHCPWYILEHIWSLPIKVCIVSSSTMVSNIELTCLILTSCNSLISYSWRAIATDKIIDANISCLVVMLSTHYLWDLYDGRCIQAPECQQRLLLVLGCGQVPWANNWLARVATPRSSNHTLQIHGRMHRRKHNVGSCRNNNLLSHLRLYSLDPLLADYSWIPVSWLVSMNWDRILL
jgi:hypothetical protein